MKYLQVGFPIAPRASFSKHEWDVCRVFGNRIQIFDFLYRVQKGGSHVNLSTVQMDKMKGFVLKPTSGSIKGYHDICIDGEMHSLKDGNELWVEPLKTKIHFYV